jgi:NCS1 family nucleobase:cation symporter-1
MENELQSDLTAEEIARIEPGPLYNDDLAPIDSASRKWGTKDIAFLWVGMSVCIPTYMLASSLISDGMNWWQAILTVALGNLIVLIPMILNGHAGTKYGITFPVYARAAFGVYGTHIASVLRAIVACGWFGIQAWIGGTAIYAIACLIWPGLVDSPVITFFSNEQVQVNVGQFLCFLFFWALNIGLFWKGMESIRFIENLGAPLLLLLGVALLIWAYIKADGFGPMLSQPSQFDTPAQFWAVFFPGLTAMVGFWATLSLNIPDFTREAKSQKDQVLGQFIGLNATMPLYAFIGVAVTSATVVIFGEAIWDPVQLLSKFENPLFVTIAMPSLALATLTTNLAANVVAPSTAFSNFLPKRISLRTGGIITGIIGIVMMPWKLIADPSGYIFTWLIGYSALLGPIGGILVCDYFIINGTKYNLSALYEERGIYYFMKGYNPAGILALIIGIMPNIPGFIGQVSSIEVPAFFSSLYNYAWFTGFILALIVYYILMKLLPQSSKAQ